MAITAQSIPILKRVTKKKKKKLHRKRTIAGTESFLSRRWPRFKGSYSRCQPPFFSSSLPFWFSLFPFFSSLLLRRTILSAKHSSALLMIRESSWAEAKVSSLQPFPFFVFHLLDFCKHLSLEKTMGRKRKRKREKQSLIFCLWSRKMLISCVCSSFREFVSSFTCSYSWKFIYACVWFAKGAWEKWKWRYCFFLFYL